MEKRKIRSALIRKMIHTVLFLLPCLHLAAQEYKLDLLLSGGSEIRGLVPATASVSDSIQVYRVLKQSLTMAHEQGYLAVSVDSLVFDSLGVQAHIWAGPKFSWGSLSFASIDPRILRSTRIRPQRFESKFLQAEKLAAIQAKLIEYYENRGYPFATAWIDSMGISGNRISGQLRIDLNDIFVIDSLHIKGDVKIHPSYIEKLTGIVPGEAYNEERIRKISGRIQESVFLEELRPFELEFFKGGVDVYTYLKKSRANQFNGIIGVLPGHEKTGKLLVTGEVNLLLLNSLSRGESLYFGWSSLEPQTQKLDIQITYPYVFSSSAGVGFDFELLRQDTTYLTLNPVIDLRFFLGGGNYLNAFYDHFSSSVISTDGLENALILPPYADVSSSLYGLGIQYNNLDYPFNPSRGWNIHARLGIGSRKIRKNPSIPGQAYEGVDLNTTKLQSTATLSVFQPLAGRFVLHFSAMSGYLRNDHLFKNELFRLGGMNSLRGVDENSIYASAYGLGRIETRFLFERNSALFIFLDGGYYEKALKDDFSSDFPMGFGAGLQLGTGAGIFLLNYALGRQFDNPINIGKAKIHAGYVNRF